MNRSARTLKLSNVWVDDTKTQCLYTANNYSHFWIQAVRSHAFGVGRCSGESKPERTGTLFRGPVETEESVSGPQNVNIRTGTVVPGPR